MEGRGANLKKVRQQAESRIKTKPIIRTFPAQVVQPPIVPQEPEIQNAAVFLEPINNPPPAITTPQELRNVLSPISSVGIDNINPEPEDLESGKFLASLIAQGAAGFGAGIMGGSSQDILRSTGMFDRMRESDINRQDRLRQNELLRAERLGERQERQSEKQDRLSEIKRREDQAKLLTDPNSEESKRRREVYKSLGLKVSDNLSFTDLNDPIVLQSLRDKMQEQKIAAMPRGGIGVGGEGKAKEKKNPFQKEVTEISIRSKNALDSLNKIENIVRQYGTRELTGSQEKELEQLIQNVAVNYNKVLDPTSVVREGEAKQVAESLGLGGFGSYFTNKDTALKQVQSFRDLVTNSRNNALSGYSNLPSDTDFDEKDQFVIDEYRKNPNDPKVKELYNDMLRSKGLR